MFLHEQLMEHCFSVRHETEAEHLYKSEILLNKN